MGKVQHTTTIILLLMTPSTRTTYWLMFSNPYVFQFLQYLFSIPLVEQLFTAADGVMRTSSVIRNGIEGVALNPELGQDKWVAKILCGTLSGCGGGLWVGTCRC